MVDAKMEKLAEVMAVISALFSCDHVIDFSIKGLAIKMHKTMMW